MLTAWAKKMIPFVGGVNNTNTATYILPSIIGATESSAPGVIEGKDYQGNTKYFQPMIISTKTLVTTLSTSNYGFAFGTGDTPATENDYTIESIISSGLSASFSPISYFTGENSYNSEDDEMSMYIDITLTNTSQDSITIKEMCRFGYGYYSDTKGSTPSSRTVTLLDRIVLDSPITIPAGEVIVLRYETIIPLS